MYSSPVRHSPPTPCGAVLPFDLHVLGMPPAFSLSQDQTLQLKLQIPKDQFFRRPTPTKNIKTTVSIGAPCIAWTNHRPPGAHTSHLRTLSKIFPRESLRGMSISPKGAAHYRGDSRSVNTR